MRDFNFFHRFQAHAWMARVPSTSSKNGRAEAVVDDYLRCTTFPFSRAVGVTAEGSELVTAYSRNLDKLIKGLLYVANAQNCRNG